MTVATPNMEQVFFVMVSTNEYNMGLYLSTCVTCKTRHDYTYRVSANAIVQDKVLTSSAKMFKDNKLVSLSMQGIDVSDSFKIFFQRQNRSTLFETHFMGINNMAPSINEFWDGFIGI